MQQYALQFPFLLDNQTCQWTLTIVLEQPSFVSFVFYSIAMYLEKAKITKKQSCTEIYNDLSKLKSGGRCFSWLGSRSWKAVKQGMSHLEESGRP